MTAAKHMKAKPTRTRAGRVLAVIGAAGIAASVLVVTDAFGAGSNGGDAVIVDPATNQPLAGGGSQTSWTFDLPPSPADRCAGDSASDGYRVYSYITPEANAPGDLEFDSNGPKQPAGSFAAPLFDTAQRPYIARNTAPETGQVMDFPTVQFNFNRFTIDQRQGKIRLPAGVYNMGIVCWDAINSAQDKYFNAKLTFIADSRDPNGERWVAGDAPPETTTTSTTPEETTTSTTSPSTSSSTTPPSTTTTSSTTSTTAAPPSTTSTTSTTSSTTSTTAPPSSTTSTTQAPNSQRSTFAGHALLVDPATNETMTSGGSQTNWSFKFEPAIAKCSGDSANDGYRVYSFITPFANDPAELRFDSNGPVQPPGSFAYPLFDNAARPYIARNTAPETGQVMDFPAVQFTFNRFTIDKRQGKLHLPAGDYHVGIACWDANNNAPDKYWDPKVTFTASSSDPNGEVWTAQAVEPEQTTTTTTPGATTTTTAGSGATTTTTGGSNTTATTTRNSPPTTSAVGSIPVVGGAIEGLLPRTGGSVVTTLLFGLGLLYSGTVALLWTRRRYWAGQLGGRR